MYSCYPRSAYPRPCRWVHTQTGRPLKSWRTHRYRYHTGDLAVKAGKPFWDSVYAKVASLFQDISGKILLGESSKKERPSIVRPKAGSKCSSATLYQPPSVSSVSLRLLRMLVKIGVSRSVKREPSVSRSAITRSRKSSGLSLSNATTHSWSSNPKE